MRALVRSLTGAALLALAACGSSPRQPASDATPRAAVAPSQAAPVTEEPPVAAAVPDPVPPRAAVPPLAEPDYTPRDECSALPGWPAFSERLRAAVQARDATALAGLAAPDVLLDYGGGSGTGELAKRLADPKAPLWHELDDALSLGCAIQGGLAVQPWYFWNLPDDIDSASTMVVTGSDVPLHARPSATAEPVAMLDWPMVTIDSVRFDPKARFNLVRTREGRRKGYVETTRMRGVLAYRLIAEPNNGDWRITAFVAGD